MSFEEANDFMMDYIEWEKKKALEEIKTKKEMDKDKKNLKLTALYFLPKIIL